jgi:hypothetical protein
MEDRWLPYLKRRLSHITPRDRPVSVPPGARPWGAVCALRGGGCDRPLVGGSADRRTWFAVQARRDFGTNDTGHHTNYVEQPRTLSFIVENLRMK